MVTSRPPHLQGLYDNFGQVQQLTLIHEQLTRTERGRRFGTDILNSSGIVLSVACWESFVEDLAELAFEFLATNAKTPDDIPAKILVLASKPLSEAQDKRAVWQLAGDGWRTVIDTHRRLIISAHLGGFNTPRQQNVDRLFEQLIGLKDLSSAWDWHKNSTVEIVAKLDNLISLRGQIAHRVTSGGYVTKSAVNAARQLILRLAVTSSNRVAEYIESVTGQMPWEHVTYGSAS